MKKRIAILVLLATPFLTLHAETTPEDMILRYFDAFQRGDVEALASIMHEGELAKFKKTLLPVIEVNLMMDPVGASRDAAAVRQFAGPDDVETIRAESPTAFFTRFMNWMIKLNPTLVKSMAGATIQPLGSILEDDMAHVTYRIQLSVMGASMTQLKVMSVKKQDGEWRLMMPGELEGLGKLMPSANRP
jgi:hypothetical protein